MSQMPAKLVIDARPRGPHGLLAGESVLGRPVIDHLLDLAESVGDHRGPVAIHAREDDHDRLRTLLAVRPSSRYRLALGPPPEDSAILRSDRFYDRGQLRRALRRGQDPESAVIWRIDRPQSLATAEDEIRRRKSYQPLGRFWATRPALALARQLAPTRIRPNMVTLASAGLMLAAAGLIGFGRGVWTSQIFPSLAMALALILDTADGHLARLQGTASNFGRWLDSNLDELGDMGLHAAVAWAAFTRSGNPGWLVVGMVYGMAKYLFVFGTHSAADMVGASAPYLAARRPGLIRRLAHWAGHADIRWHLWIVLAALGRLDAALIAYAVYFLARSVGGAIRKAAYHVA
jgi:phosphatidylglycerophosphate synthase